MSHHTIHIYCNSEDSKEYYPDNTAVDFRVNLRETLNIPGRWVCALTDIKIPEELNETAFLCCDLCDSSLTVSQGRYPILRRIPIPWSSILPLVYVPVKKDTFNAIHLYLRNSRGGSFTSTIKGTLECTLQLKRHE